MALRDVWMVPPVRPNKLAKRLQADVGYLKTQKRKLKPREWKFVQELVSGDGQITMKEAAIRAGFSEASAKSIAWRLTNPEICPHIVAAIQEYRAELAAKYGTTYERHMKDLQAIRDAALAAGAYGAAVQAEYRRGQALGTIYVDRKEIRHGTIDTMSKEEVERKLEEIKMMYGGPPSRILEMDAREVVETVEVEPPFQQREALEAIPDALPGIDPSSLPPPIDEDEEQKRFNNELRNVRRAERRKLKKEGKDETRADVVPTDAQVHDGAHYPDRVEGEPGDSGLPGGVPEEVRDGGAEGGEGRP
jgi:phage terminase small subunit